MSTPATYYTKLYPKRGDLTGSLEQAYNLLPAKYFDHILGGIGAGTIAALGTVAPGSYHLSYTVRLTSIHYRVSGNQNFCFAPTETIDGRVKKIRSSTCGMV
jgi:hypothetical protein